jgi:hypothetical protein
LGTVNGQTVACHHKSNNGGSYKTKPLVKTKSSAMQLNSLIENKKNWLNTTLLVVKHD